MVNALQGTSRRNRSKNDGNLLPKHKRYQANIREKQVELSAEKVDNPSLLGKKRANDPDRFIHSTYVTDDGEVAKKVVTLSIYP